MQDEGLLSHEQTLELIKKAREGDEAAKEEIYIKNAALVRSIVKRFIGRGIDYEDLYQLGCMGLVKAVNNYDESFGVRFSTYAVPLIMGEVRRFLRDDGSLKVSRPIKELYAKAMAAKEKLLAQLGYEPGIEDIAKEIDCTSEDIIQAMEASKMPASLNAAITDDGSRELTLSDCIVDGNDESSKTIDRVLLQGLLKDLPPRERQIIILRYFLENTQSEIAKQLGISQVQVSRMESKIIKKLRDSVSGKK